MPIYDYRCLQCGHEFEALVLKSSSPACPSCEGRDLEQLVSGFSVSSDGIRRQNSQSSIRAQRASRDTKDKAIAHTEYVKKHND